MPEGFSEVADVRCVAAHAHIYEHGWQTGSPTGIYGLESRPSRARAQVRQTMCYRPQRPPPTGTFQGEGALALLPGDGTVRLWTAPAPHVEVPSIRAEVRGDRVVISADGNVEERAVTSGDLNKSLAAWAEGIGTRLGVSPVRSLPPVWCSWYFYREHVTEADVVANLIACDRLDLDVSVIQVDDGHQCEIGDWLEPRSGFGSLDRLVRRIADSGRRTGIWIAPFLAGANSRVAQAHPDWLVGDAWAGHHWDQDLFAIDVTHPDASEYLVDVFRTFAEWGIDYFKLDFIYAGALEGRRRAAVTGIAAYREGLRLIRAAVGDDAVLLACGAPILPSIGVVDAMRVSPDVGPRYEPPDGDLSQPALRSALATGRARAWQHARWWTNDPDCLIVRPEVERREEWAEHVALSGGLVASSDALDALDDWGLEITRRLLRPSSTSPVRWIADPGPGQGTIER